jgi:hypothetical protein
MWPFAMWKILALVWGVIVYVVLIVVVVVGAGKRGRNRAAWAIWAILFSPLLAGFMLLCLGEWKPSEKREVKAAAVEAAPSQALLAEADDMVVKSGCARPSDRSRGRKPSLCWDPDISDKTPDVQDEGGTGLVLGHWQMSQ